MTGQQNRFSLERVAEEHKPLRERFSTHCKHELHELQERQLSVAVAAAEDVGGAVLVTRGIVVEFREERVEETGIEEREGGVDESN